MYKILKNKTTDELFKIVNRLTDNAFIPFDSSNSDYQKFKVDIANGVELQDADSNIMTTKQVQDFLKTLP